RENESIWNAAIVRVVISQGVVDIDFVPQIQNGVAPQVRKAVCRWLPVALPIETEPRGDTPVRLKIFGDLSIDRADNFDNFRIVHCGVIDDRDQHGSLLWWMGFAGDTLAPE